MSLLKRTTEKLTFWKMALRVIRLRSIIKKISVLSAVEIDLSKTKASIEANLASKEAERRILDEKIDNGKITPEEWSLKTDVVDYLIAENQLVIAEMETKINNLESERYNLQAQLKDYDNDDIIRIMNSIGIWN